MPRAADKVGSEDLYRDLAAMLQIAGEVDHGHATPVDLTLDGVPAPQSLREAFHGIVAHRPFFVRGGMNLRA